MRRDASSRAFSRWRMRSAQPIRLSYHPGLMEGSIFSRLGVLPTVPSEIFCEGQVKATEGHLTTAHFWAINKFTFWSGLDWPLLTTTSHLSTRWQQRISVTPSVIWYIHQRYISTHNIHVLLFVSIGYS